MLTVFIVLCFCCILGLDQGECIIWGFNMEFMCVYVKLVEHILNVGVWRV